MRRSHMLLVPVLATLLSACGGRPRTPVVTPRSTQVTGVVSGGLAMRIDLLIYNPNAHDLTVRSMSARVEAQGSHLGDVQHAQQLNLPAGQNVPFVAEVTVPWGNLPSLAATALLSSGVPYTVRGRVLAVWQSFQVQAPFELEGVIPQSMLLRLPGGLPIPGFKSPATNPSHQGAP